ncbi:MAG: hypothetical protein JSR54_00645 [Proteobacteria bacterium]|nr:hypothetical protein [Pseudomonadota bacterium]
MGPPNTRRPPCALWFVAVVALLALPVAGVASPASSLQTVSVATPATPTRWSAVAGGLMQLVDPWGDADKALRLKRLAAEDRFDLPRRMQQHLLEALASRGRVAVPLTIQRPPELSPGPLARDRLPEKLLPGVLLDVSVEWFGVYRSGALEPYRPMVAVGFRVVGAGGMLEQSTRRILYNVPASLTRGGEVVVATGDCDWKSFDAVTLDRARLWGCMDAALEQVADRIGMQVPGP